MEKKKSGFVPYAEWSKKKGKPSPATKKAKPKPKK